MAKHYKNGGNQNLDPTKLIVLITAVLNLITAAIILIEKLLG